MSSLQSDETLFVCSSPADRFGIRSVQLMSFSKYEWNPLLQWIGILPHADLGKTSLLEVGTKVRNLVDREWDCWYSVLQGAGNVPRTRGREPSIGIINFCQAEMSRLLLCWASGGIRDRGIWKIFDLYILIFFVVGEPGGCNRAFAWERNWNKGPLLFYRYFTLCELGAVCLHVCSTIV